MLRAILGVAPSREDQQTWDHSLKSYKGAFSLSLSDGRLSGHIPIEKQKLKLLWDILQLPFNAKSWGLIDECNECLLGLDAIKLVRLVLWKYWVCQLSLYFLLPPPQSVSLFEGIVSFGGESIPDLFLSLGRMLDGQEPPPPLPKFARQIS
jgi:hypothetical protein